MPSRRGSGEGTTERLPSGLWRGSISRDGRRIKGPARKTEKEALDALHEKLKSETKIEAPNQSLSSWAHAWVSAKRLSPTTKEVYNWWIDAFDKDGIGSMPLAKINDQAVKLWRDRQTHSPSTVKKRLGFLKTVLRAAGIETTIRPPKTEKSLRRPLTPQERTELMEKLKAAPELTKLAILLCLQMGLSRSEACGLMWEDYAHGWVWIRRSTVETEGEIRVKSTKTNNRVRRIKVPPMLLPFFEVKRKGFVLGSGKTPMSPHHLSNKLAYLIEGTSLENVPFMGLHTLRRTFGMMLLEAGVDIVTAAELMGHDPIMLAKVYAGSRDDLKEDAMERAFGQKAS